MALFLITFLFWLYCVILKGQWLTFNVYQIVILVFFVYKNFLLTARFFLIKRTDGIVRLARADIESNTVVRLTLHKLNPIKINYFQTFCVYLLIFLTKFLKMILSSCKGYLWTNGYKKNKSNKSKCHFW